MQIFKPIIYGLVDPLEPNHIRYVGIASYVRRPRSHEYEAISSDKNTHKLAWVRKLLSECRTYEVIVLEEFEIGVSREILIAAEIKHIADKRSLGHNLTNGTDGGDGTINPTPEIRAKWSQAQSSRYQDPEQRKKTKEICNKPSVFEKRSESQKKQWENRKNFKDVSLEEQIRRIQERIRIYTSIIADLQRDLKQRLRAQKNLEKSKTKLEILKKSA